jgi:hypothetical protein
MHDPFSLGREDFFNVAYEFERLPPRNRLLPGILLRFRFDFVRRKKLLRLSTGGSTGTVVTPVDVCHGDSSSSSGDLWGRLCGPIAGDATVLSMKAG